jgi:hypothetical protein
VLIVHLRIIHWIVWMGSRRDGRGLARLLDSCCEVIFVEIVVSRDLRHLTHFNCSSQSDHGFDCICTLFHLATVSSYLCCGGTYWFMAIQTSLQLAFFMAQWVSD